MINESYFWRDPYHQFQLRFVRLKTIFMVSFEDLINESFRSDRDEWKILFYFVYLRRKHRFIIIRFEFQ